MIDAVYVHGDEAKVFQNIIFRPHVFEFVFVFYQSVDIVSFLVFRQTRLSWFRPSKLPSRAWAHFFPRYRAVSYVNLIGRFIRDDVGKSTQSELLSALWKIPANFALVVDSKITYFLRTLIGHERHFRRVSVQETSKYDRTDCWKPTLVVLIVHRCVRSRCRDLDIFCIR